MGDPIDHSVGLEMLVRIGDRVQLGQPLVRIFAHDCGSVEDGVEKAITISDSGESLELIVDRIAAGEQRV